LSFLLRVLDLGKRATRIRFAPRRPLTSNVRSGGLFRNMQANRALSNAGKLGTNKGSAIAPLVAI